MSYRFAAGCGCLAAFAALGFAYYLQYVQGLDPCPMCIFQRIAMFATGVVFAVAAFHGPRSAARWGYAVLAASCAAIGAAIAARHVWLQSLPPDQVPSCGPSLDYLLKIMPWREVVAKVLRGDASCAHISASLWGISLPGWTLLGFAALALWALIGAAVARRSAIDNPFA